ncbi:glycosyltransferase family 2 protein [archaeon]|nr:glycosyltransferase family 2 protein [archaeon]
MRWRTLIGITAFALFVFGCISIFSLFNPYWIFTISSAVYITQACIFLFAFEESKIDDPKPKNYPSLTIMVPAYNASKTILKSLEHVKALKYPKPFDIVVIEDGSKDDTYEKIKNIPGIRIIRNKKNKGKAESLNQAIKILKTDLIANIDSDTYPEPETLKNMVGYFNDPKVGAVTTLIVPENPKGFLRRIQEFEYYVAFGFWHKSISTLDSLYVTPGPMSIYRTDALRDVGGFEKGNITEDLEIALALQEKRWKIKCSVNSKVKTEIPGDIIGYIKQRTRWYRGKFYNTIKYKHLLFRREYGHFGMFVFPGTLIVEILAMIVFIGFLTVNFKRFLIEANNYFRLISLGLIRWEFILQFDPLTIPPYLIFLVATLLIWGYLLYKSLKFDKRKVKIYEIPYICFYLIFYSIFITTAYAIGFFNELRGSERKW